MTLSCTLKTFLITCRDYLYEFLYISRQIFNMKSTCLPAAITAIIMTALICMPCDAFPAFPDPDPAWKNVSVAGKRMSVYCIFKDSRDIVWLGTNDGLFFYDGVTTHAAGQSTTAGNRVYSILEQVQD